MSDWQFPQDSGHTPLSEEDRQGLLLSHIATRDDLNDAEQRNITKALRRRAPSVHKLLDDMYLRDLHKAMFGDVWEWAGKYRQRVTNIGVAPAHIPDRAAHRGPRGYHAAARFRPQLTHGTQQHTIPLRDLGSNHRTSSGRDQSGPPWSCWPIIAWTYDWTGLGSAETDDDDRGES